MEWAMESLGSLCEILDSQRRPITKRDRVEGPYPYYGATGILDYVEGFIFDEDLVLVGEDGAKWGAGDNSAFPISGRTWVNNHAHVVKPFREKVTDAWLVYYLNGADLSSFITGMTVPKLNQGKLKEIPIPLPPIPKQKRIVAILDQAFADIDRVRELTERNLQNARELFESYLYQVQGQKKPLGDFVEIRTGRLNANAAVKDGKYPFFTCSREVFAIDDYSFDCEAILLAGNNASGDFNVKHYNGKFNAYQRTYVLTINKDAELIYGFLYFQMLKSLQELKKTSVGSATKFLKLGMIKSLKISVPSKEQQIEVLGKLISLKKGIDSLEKSYLKKMNAVDELKRSLFQKAFSGELTEDDKGVAA